MSVSTNTIARPSAITTTVEVEYRFRGREVTGLLVTELAAEGVAEFEFSETAMAELGIDLPRKAVVKRRRYVIDAMGTQRLVIVLKAKPGDGLLGALRGFFGQLDGGLQFGLALIAGVVALALAYEAVLFLLLGGPAAGYGWLVEHLWIALALLGARALWAALFRAADGDTSGAVAWCMAALFCGAGYFWWDMALRPAAEITGPAAYAAYWGGVLDRFDWAIVLFLPWLPVLSFLGGVLGITVLSKFVDLVKSKE